MMGSLKALLPFLLSSFVSIAAIMVLLALVKPEVFSLVPGVFPPDPVASPDKATAGTDSLAQDSLRTIRPDTTAFAASIESTLVRKAGNSTWDTVQQHAARKDTVKNPVKHLEQSGISVAVPERARRDTLNEVELKRMVQIFESMDPESAAKILNNMDDFAVRQVLTTMKKRQSAKILSILEPKRAARILNEGTDL